MDWTALQNTVNQLVQFKNSIISNSKKIPDLPASTNGNKLVAVHNETSLETEQFDLTAALSGVYSLTNGILALGEITRVDDTFTFGVGFQWRINGTVYTNAEIDRNIHGAGTGNHRIDIAVLDVNNDIYIIEGFEVPLADTVAQPSPEPDTLFLCSFLIEEDVISAPVFSGTALFLQKVRIRKGYGNLDTDGDEIGDIFQFGMIFESNPVFVDFAIWTGGDINDNDNFSDKTWKEITTP